MLNCGRIVGLTSMRSIRCYGEERRGVFGDVWVSRFLQSWEEEVQCRWCVVWSFASVSLSLSVGVLGCGPSSAFFWSASCREICLLYRISLMIGSDWVFFVFHGLSEKLLLIIIIIIIIFFFLTNFIDISLCADPMRRNPFSPLWRKSQHR